MENNNDKLDLVDYLNLELEGRKKKNSGYSLRAYGRDLSIQPATLSHILKRKRQISDSVKKKIYSHLGLSKDQIQYFEGKNNNGVDVRYKKFDFDTFAILSDWYYDAICELVRVKGFESDVDYVARRLGLLKNTAKEAVDKLFDLELLKESPNKTWIETTGNDSILGGDTTNLALQKLQKQLLEKAIEALKETPKDQREQASMVMAINKNDLPEAKKRIKEFQRDMCKYLQRPNRPSDEVYQLVTTLYPLTDGE